MPIIIIIIIIVIIIIIIVIIIKATSKTQKLILIYTEVNIYFVSWTKVSLNNRPSSKALNRQNWKKQSSKLPPHWGPLESTRWSNSFFSLCTEGRITRIPPARQTSVQLAG